MQNLITVQNRIPKLLEIINPFINSISLNITTDEEEINSGDTLIKIKEYIKYLDDDRKQFIDPLRKEIDGIMDRYRPLNEKLKGIDETLRRAIKTKQQEDNRKAQEALRLQREKEAKEREEAEGKAFESSEEIARLLRESKQASFEDQIIIDKQIKENVIIAEQAEEILTSQVPVIIEAPKTKIQTASGTVFQKAKYIITNFDTIDIKKLPYEYLIIDKKKLQKAVDMGIRIDGVDVVEDFDMVTRKK